MLFSAPVQQVRKVSVIIFSTINHNNGSVAVPRNLHHTTITRATNKLVGLAEDALDALCEAVDPCLLVQPVASLAQYGNTRLKVLFAVSPQGSWD